jgi:hypothetical protein
MIQHIGTATDNGFGRIQFSNSGSKMLFYDYKGLLELYDFDRCTGLLSNPNTIYPENTQAPWPQLWSALFSPSNNVLYVSHTAAFPPADCFLVQYDLTAANIAATADTLWTTPFTHDMGQLKLTPDGKIYQSNNYYGGYPYNDTTYNFYNKNLSVINYPDSLGAACDLQPYSFYLGGKRTYFGLPNNPDYELGAVTGSVCDTVTGISPTPALPGGEGVATLYAFYHAGWQKLFVNAQNIKGKNCLLQIFDVTGKEVYRSAKVSPLGVGGSGGYFTRDVNCAAFAKGMYIVSLQTEKEKLVKKFVKK